MRTVTNSPTRAGSLFNVVSSVGNEEDDGEVNGGRKRRMVGWVKRTVGLRMMMARLMRGRGGGGGGGW